MITPAGGDVEANWKVLAEGRSLATHDPDLAGLRVDISCRVEGFDAALELGPRLANRLDRFAHLGIVAARQAVADARLDLPAARPCRVGVVVGVGGNSLHTYVREFTLLGSGKPARVSPLALPRSIPSMVAGEIALDLGVRGPNFTVSSACASGTNALGVARDILLGGGCDVVLAGGAESGRAPMTAATFAQMRALSARTDRPWLACRPFDRERDGFVLGEGAAILVLERAEHARRRGAPVRAVLRGHGAAADAHHPVHPHPEGEGTVLAVQQALADAGCSPRDIGHVNAHGTSTPAGDAAEARALRRLFPTSVPAVTAVKSVVGHALGAAGAIEAAVTVLSLQRGEVPPTANLGQQDPGLELDIVTGGTRRIEGDLALSTSCGFGGQNAALVFGAA
ncbi:beta-ketoacyl-[acyl-carrier-protein] synthase family protein [Streptomyces millisiae]|uniref:Beta-ketoacyl-[acyl-carrier-protein] synthase family protein n=1 Tax=Streptomyces millisiae TaxID=3075542 RepID=A0ABU2LHM9_9ACTN|nr:beta-ketoacyl-[acyl-carrier-protein] synthase family protein [Streptomyces sp. DSM 44918]MDT0317089.1 beta-ketoacyl-[acyl-carrier-protein] synthase family protein [Streptomyces sp. DSM 44918]